MIPKPLAGLAAGSVGLDLLVLLFGWCLYELRQAKQRREASERAEDDL